MNPVLYFELGKDKTFAAIANSIAGISSYKGGVLAPNGKIYMAPYQANQVLKFDPEKSTCELIGTDYTSVGAQKWGGAVLAPNGKIYCGASNAPQILKIDPETDTTSLIGTVNATTSKHAGGVLAPNGKIYFAPINATQILQLDPETDTTTLVGATISGTVKYYTGVLASNGYIYFIPRKAGQVLKFNPDTNGWTLIGTNYGVADGKWEGGILALNDNIYAPPATATGFTTLKINPATDTVSQIGEVYGGNTKWGGGILAPDGNIYFSALTFSGVLVLDPVTEVQTIIVNSLVQSGGYFGGAIGANGLAYHLPSSPVKRPLRINIGNYPNIVGSSLILPSDLSTLAASAYNRHYNH